MLETEGFHQQREAGVAGFVDEFAHPLAQRVGREVARVDAVRGFLEGFEQLAFALDALRERRQAVGQRMAAPRLGEALHERVGLGFEEQHVRVADASAQRLHRAGQFVEALAAAHVDADRDARVARLVQEVDE